MNRHLLFLTLTMTVCCTTLPSLAQGSTAPFAPGQTVAVAGISSTGSLNVRQGPATTHPVVATLPANRAGLTIISCDDALDWCRIGRDDAALGWVSTRYLRPLQEAASPSPPRFSETQRLAATTGITPHKRGWTPVASLPPYLLGPWDIGSGACARTDSDTRITVQKNSLRIGAATARFKNAVFRDEGYDLTTLLIEDQDIPNAVPQRAQYRLEPDETTLTISGDVLETHRLHPCDKN